MFPQKLLNIYRNEIANFLDKLREHHLQSTPLHQSLVFVEIHPTADAVSEGTDQVHTEQHTSVQLLIQHLKMTHEISSFATYPTVSLQEFQGKIDAWRESTTTSPSGMHLGHYKALFAKHKYSHVPPLSDRAARQKDGHTGTSSSPCTEGRLR
jgi:hypothetical protein